MPYSLSSYVKRKCLITKGNLCTVFTHLTLFALLSLCITWVRSPGWEDPLEKGQATNPVFWPAEFHGLCSPWGDEKSDTTEQLSLSLSLCMNWVRKTEVGRGQRAQIAAPFSSLFLDQTQIQDKLLV